jgi:hypothetical protein
MWSTQEKRIFKKLIKPILVQQYLDQLEYNSDGVTRSVKNAIKMRKAHCFDGALIAAAALEFHGEKPLLLDLRANNRDDDHVLALFKRHGLWGALAKSNFSGLRYREPVYRTIRELALSYFEDYLNLAGEKTLREYSTPLNLGAVRNVDWRYGNGSIDPIAEKLDSIKHFAIFSRKTEKILSKADTRSLNAATLGIDKRGAFKV